MMLMAVLLAAAAPASDTVPEREMLDAFRAACHRVDDLDAMRADALAGQWEEIPESADARIEKLTRLGREAVGDEGTGTAIVYRRVVEGRPVFLIVSRFEDEDGVWGNGCRLYHFEAQAPIDPAALERWMGRPSTGVQELPGTGIKRLWEPGWRDGVTVEVNHVPAASPLRERFGLSGNILVAQAIGGF